MTGFDGKVVVVTGGARGQGAEASRLFAGGGATVVVADVLEAEGRALAAELGGDARFIRLDVRSEISWDELIDETLGALGRIDVLVNNAGVYVVRPMADTSVELFEQLLAVNTIGTFLGLKGVGAVMGPGSAIVNVSSAAGMAAAPHAPAYGATKWAVRGLTRSAARELAPRGIRVNAVMPGMVDTPMLSEHTAEMNAQAVQVIPLGRAATALEVARMVVHLAGDDASYVTGAELVVDGGFMA